MPLSREDSMMKDTSIYGSYLLWKKLDKYFITKIESYNIRTEIIPLENSVFFEYLFQNKKSIKKETIKPFTIIEIENGVKKEYTSSISDDNYIRELLVIAYHDTTYKCIDMYDMDLNSAYGRYNFNTKLWKWNVLIEEQIRQLIKQGGFRKRIRYPMYLEILGKKVAF